LFVVFAFGGILPEDIFEYPSGGSINLHGSLLPEYRGASPVQAALLDGKTETGYSIQYLARDVDSGDVITSEVIPILDNDNSETLLKRITEKGSEAILKLLKNPVNGRYPAKPQDHEKASHCKKIKPEDRKLDFSGSALSLHNRIRAFAPEKTCYFLFRNKRINIYESMLLSEKPEGLKTGELFCPDKKTLAITCGDGNLLSLIKIQPENKNPMQTLDFINGFKPQTGEKAL
ncbi:MAG: methionyl-tRNA formyltransferase, partial [Leptospiraceae bacterium]|nr:methionyl-tRNA formyltransferase [Leptospiraceae bacterium]